MKLKTIVETVGLNLDQNAISMINRIYHDIASSPETLLIKTTPEHPNGYVNEYPDPPWQPTVPTIDDPYGGKWVRFTSKNGFTFNLRVGLSTIGSAADWLEEDVVSKDTWGTNINPGYAQIWIDQKTLMNGGNDLYEELTHEISHLLDPKNHYANNLEKKKEQQKLARTGEMSYTDQDVEQQANLDALAARRIRQWQQNGINKNEALQIISKPLIPINDRENIVINQAGRKYQLALYKLINNMLP